MSEPDNEGKGFKVTDRRKFTSEGKPREETDDFREPSPEPTPSTPPSDRPTGTTGGRPAAPTQKGAGEPSSRATFLDLIGMLATNAMLQLGDIPDPTSGQRVENLQAVQDMIAFLEILEQKTKGNLTQKEGEVLEQVLYDLRMRYMAKAKILDT